MAKVFFYHGIPGSVHDMALLRAGNPQADMVALDLLTIGPDNTDLRTALGSHRDIHLVGFSIGAMVAIKIAAAYPKLVSGVTLVSPAAPLYLGDFLPHMAGKPVFELALKSPRLLAALTWAQGGLARLFPNILIKSLFAKCGAPEQELLRDRDFRTAITDALVNSFVKNPATYRAFVTAYVADWSSEIMQVQCPVDIWHGTHDTWAPPAISEKLLDAFGTRATLHRVPMAEHYSTLSRVKLR